VSGKSEAQDRSRCGRSNSRKSAVIDIASKEKGYKSGQGGGPEAEGVPETSELQVKKRGGF